MTDVASDEEAHANSMRARCERWVAAGLNATAGARNTTSSSCPCDPDPYAAGQPAGCAAVVVSADAKDAPGWWSSLFVTVLGVGFFAGFVFLFLKFRRRQETTRSGIILRRLTELLEKANGKPTYVAVVLPCGEAAAAKRLPDAEQTPRRDGTPPRAPGEDATTSGLLFGYHREVDENRERSLFQFAPAYATLGMEHALVQRLRETPHGDVTQTMARLHQTQVEEQRRIWSDIQERRRLGEVRAGGAGSQNEHCVARQMGHTGTRNSEWSGMWGGDRNTLSRGSPGTSRRDECDEHVVVVVDVGGSSDS